MQPDTVLSEVARRFSQDLAVIEELFKAFAQDRGPAASQTATADASTSFDGVEASEPQPALT
jgi:hypothetical protein